MGESKRGRHAATGVTSYLHKTGNHNDLRIKMMALKLELAGHEFASTYGLFYMLVDRIADSEFYGIEMNPGQMKMLAYDFHVSAGFLTGLIETGSDAEINLFAQEFSENKSMLTYRLISPWLNEQIAPILEARQYYREYYRTKRGTPKISKPVDIKPLLPDPPPKKELSPEIVMHPLQGYIKEHYKHVSRMRTQLTPEDCVFLIEKYTNKVVNEMLSRMDNYKPLTKNCLNVRKTLTNWIRMEGERQKGKGTGAPDLTYEPE